jgi:hypothetical protein
MTAPRTTALARLALRRLKKAENPVGRRIVTLWLEGYL